MGVGQQDGNKDRQQTIGEQDWDSLREDVGGIAGAAVERGRHFIDSAREQATGYADQRKEAVAQSVADFANSLRESTSSFDERPNIRAVVDSAAEGLEQLADSIRERSFSDIFNDFEEVARRRPATVAAVSVAIGFFAARFLKSTAEELRYERASARQGSTRNTARQGRDRSPQSRANG